MSGARPPYLTRRGAVYAIRLQVPFDLQGRLKTEEVRRSLHTKDIDVARSRCLDAAHWFKTKMDGYRGMPEITKADLEGAVRDYFDGLAFSMASAKPGDMQGLEIGQWSAMRLATAEKSLARLDDELRINVFPPSTTEYARKIIAVMTGAGLTADERTEFLAEELITRAHRQLMRFMMHRMQHPALPFAADDPVFDVERHDPMPLTPHPKLVDEARPAFATSQATVKHHTSSQFPALSDVIKQFIERLERNGAGMSHVDEVGRALDWLAEELGHDSSMAEITTASVRDFRDNMVRMDVSVRGRRMAFKERLTDIRANQIKHATASKYWGAVKGLFEWAASEGLSPHDPAEKLKLDKPKGEDAHSPEPYSRAELIRFYGTPLYRGYQSQNRTRAEGECRERGQHWWAGVLPLFTGVRAGELTQLLPSDFHFDAPIPFLRVHEFDEEGVKTKTTKTKASTRDVPIAPILLELGLRQFVDRRKKLQPKARVFAKFRLGTRGKISEGMVRYWGDYLRAFGLHKKGRGTHVWRHTVIGRLRALGVIEEDIAAFVGHGHGTITSRYGGEYPLERKKPVADILSYDIDLVSLLGGPYEEKIHRG